MVAPAANTNLDENLDPYTTDKETTKLKSNPSAKSVAATRPSKKKKINAAQTKLKASDSESEDENRPRSTIAKDMIEQAYYRKIQSEALLQDRVLAIIQVRQIGDLTGPVSKPRASSNRLNAVKILLDLHEEAGLVTGEFAPDSRFGMELGAIQSATQDLFDSLKVLVGEHVQTPDLNNQTGSSHYAAATSAPDSDFPQGPQRMSLGSSGAKYLRTRTKRQDQRPAGPIQTPKKLDRHEERRIPAGRTTPTTNSTGSSNKLDEYFQMAMVRFLREQSLETTQPQALGTRDIDLESVGTPDPHSWEYDPDDLGIPSSSGHTSSRAAVDTAAIGPGGVRISVISDQKEFSGKDIDEDRARTWIGKVTSAFRRDQATEEEKCLTFADLMLSRTTKITWADLLESFHTQYRCLGMSVAWQYYHARKRSEETPLDYIYRLNVAALRAKLKIKDGNPKARQKHVDHYIETLGDPELTDRLTLLRLANVDELEEVLRARERAKGRQRRSAFGSKYRQKAPVSAAAAPARAMVRAVQAQDPGSESEGVSGSDGSDSEGELRRIFLVAAEEKLIGTGAPHNNQIRYEPVRKLQRKARSLNAGPRVIGIVKNENVVRIADPENTRI
ncbi:hypothetical protein PHMEG_00013519 [Phytophthora megakarya]|uniref:Retrotransposon gag domain-containing protein n=1 Tax=Phytophthora megakarya TaxID=4795 RepID=A0A225W734_9STRA|nr:hypothetical protein PHMEG_00013519 [Phytophthora megakarya]